MKINKWKKKGRTYGAQHLEQRSQYSGDPFQQNLKEQQQIDATDKTNSTFMLYTYSITINENHYKEKKNAT